MPQKCTVKRPRGGVPGAQRILSAAERLFAQHGFSGASVHSIAMAAGVSKATVFHHFRSKEMLYREVLAAASREFSKQISMLPQDGAALHRCVELFASRQLEHMLRRSQVSRIVLREIVDGGTQRSLRLTAHVLAENFARLVDLLKGGQATGLVRADVDCAAAACVLIAANVFFFQTRRVLPYLPGVSFGEDPGAYSCVTTAVVLSGILDKCTRGADQRS